MRTNGTLRRRQLGRELRRLREEAGLTLEEAGPKLDWSTSKLGRIETGRQGVDVHGVRSMLDLYDVGGACWTEIIELTREAQKKGWWHAYGIRDQGYLALEADAVVVHEYQLAYVPGLLQTEDYMRALFRNSRRRPTDAEIARDVEARLFRQRRLTEVPALELVAIVDESALRRPVGEVEVMRAQLRQVVARAALPSVEPEIAYVEHTASALHLEKEGAVQACKLVFDRLRSEALSPRDSVALVERLAAGAALASRLPNCPPWSRCATPRTPPGPSWRSPTPSGTPSSTASEPARSTDTFAWPDRPTRVGSCTSTPNRTSSHGCGHVSRGS